MKHTFLIAILISLTVVLLPAWALAQPVLYSADAGNQSLYTTDYMSAFSTVVGPFNAPGAMSGLAYSPLGDTMYGTSIGTDSLYSVNYATGNATPIGSLGVPHMEALGFDASTNTLYGAVGHEGGDGLYEINTSTGQTSFIGNIGYFHADPANTVRGLAVHPVTNELYGVVSGPESHWSALITIDKNTALGSLIGINGSHLSDIAFHPETSVLYGLDDTYRLLNRIDALSGATTLIGPTYMDNPLGLTFTPEPATLSLLVLAFGYVLWSRRRH